MTLIKTDLNRALRPYLGMTTSVEKFGKVTHDLTPEEQIQLQRLLDTQLHLMSAVLATPEAMRISIGQHQINQAIGELEKRFNTLDDFEATLEANDLNRHKLAESLQYQLHCDTVLDFVSQQYSPFTERQAQAYYFRNLEKFKQPERRRASHILITINDNFAENTRTAAKARLKKLRGKLTSDNFAHYATRHSECPTAMNEGKLGLVPKGQLHKELDEHLFSMTAPEISGLLESEAGFHLLYCEEIQPAHTVSFNKAKQKIMDQHNQQAKIKTQRAWIASLLSS